MIPYARQDITEEDKKAVRDVLESDWLTQGPMVEKFEKSVVDYTGGLFATAVNSATSALHISCLALGVKTGDYVWTSPNTFVSSANCAIYCGAKLDFVDIDSRTFNMSINHLEKKLIDAKKSNKLPKVVIPVHFGGLPCDMSRIHELSKEYKFKIIEDASHAIGSSYMSNKKINIKIGSCAHSDVTVFSFHPVKIITTGEGGMAVTNNRDIDTKIKLFRTHGITRDQASMSKKSDGPWFYQQIDLGFNYRMNDMQAALGYQQMKRLNSYIKKRNDIANYYSKELRDLPINTPLNPKGIISSFHLYVITLYDNFSKKDHLEIFKKLRAKGIGVNLHYIPVHTHPYYMQMGFKKGDFIEAEKYYEKAISLPMFPNLIQDDQDNVIKTLKEYLQ